MNPLEEYPHLFANGLFSVRQADKNGNETIYGFGDWGVDEGELCLFGRDQMGEIKSVTYPLISQCQLIARPIEDVSEEEIRKMKPEDVFTEDLFDKEYVDWYKSTLSDYPPSYGISSVDMLYLLSIGVYPFNQSHFGDTVIDTRTLKTNEVS